MLSGESAIGKYPVKAVRMLAKIAASIEPEIEFVNNPPSQTDETHALSEALNAIDKTLKLRCIATFTTTGYTALIASGERPKVPVVAFTPNIEVYHRLNLIWGIEPIHVEEETETFEDLVRLTETQLRDRHLARTGDFVLIMGGIPTRKPKGTNFLKIHTIDEDVP